MSSASVFFVAASSIVFALGWMHLILTFRSSALHPRNRRLKEEMSEVPLLITDQTTLWKAWVGFNASHSLGAILFGGIYGYLAWQAPSVLSAHAFLVWLGFAVLVTYAVLAWRYWFRVPLAGMVLALILYTVGVLAR